MRNAAQVVESSGLRNVDQPFGHFHFSSQILLSSEHHRSNDLAAVGSKVALLHTRRDNCRALTWSRFSLFERSLGASIGILLGMESRNWEQEVV
jgi:hypothetical protein